MGGHCRDFADTARIVDTLDLVISIDSAVAHLAGALGKPVWLLLLEVADWRWGLEGEATPWYPSARLFRQSDDEGWPPVLGRVAGELASLTAGKLSRPERYSPKEAQMAETAAPKTPLLELYDVITLPEVRSPMALGFKTDEIRRVISVGPSAYAALAA